MTTFILDRSKDDHYVGCAAGNTTSVVVYKLNSKREVMVFDHDWRTLKTITPGRKDAYASLTVNGFPVNIPALARDLHTHRLRVNWLGYCFQEPPMSAAAGASNRTDPVNQFKRMNDMLNWLPYGPKVNPKTAVKDSLRWDRVDIIKAAPKLYDLSDLETVKPEVKPKQDPKESQCKKDLIKAKDRLTILEHRIIELGNQERVIVNDRNDKENTINVLTIEKGNVMQINVQLQAENNRLIQELATLRRTCNNPRVVTIPCPPPYPIFYPYNRRC